MFILTKVLDEFLNDMKQEHRIDELKHELMKAIVGYVFPRLSLIYISSYSDNLSVSF